VALAKSCNDPDSAHTAEEILNEMERLYAYGNKDVSPNTIVFNAVIDAWAQSSHPHKTDRTLELLIKMETSCTNLI
jgi:hypothetical protein